MNFKRYDENYLAKKFGVSRRVFHKNIKDDIISDFEEELSQMKINNPDIYLDSDDNITLVDVRSGKYIVTNLNVNDYNEQ